MKINRLVKQYKSLADLHFGDVFERKCDGQIFIRMNPSARDIVTDKIITAVRLRDGAALSLSLDDSVELLYGAFEEQLNSEEFHYCSEGTVNYEGN